MLPLLPSFFKDPNFNCSNDLAQSRRDVDGCAVQMLGDKKARVGESAGRNNPVNRFVNKFLLEVRDRAMPVDLDHPQDEGIADGGKRVENIALASAACTELIQVHRC